MSYGEYRRAKRRKAGRAMWLAQPVVKYNRVRMICYGKIEGLITSSARRLEGLAAIGDGCEQDAHQ
jgi:hypothetical protein